MHRDSKFIFESYKALKEQSNLQNVQQDDVQNIVGQIKQEVEGKDIAQVLALVQGSNLSADVKKAMQQLLQNGNVLSIYKQIKGIPAAAQSNPDLVNLQAGSVSEPGSPSATGYNQPTSTPAPTSKPVAPTAGKKPLRFSF